MILQKRKIFLGENGWCTGEYDSFADCWRVFFCLFVFFCNAGTGYLLYVATNCVFITIHIGWLPVVWCEGMLRTQLSLGELQLYCMLYRIGYSKKFVSGIVKLLVNIAWTLFPLICYVLILFVFNIKDTAIREVLLTNVVKIHKPYCKVRCTNSRNDQNISYLSIEKITDCHHSHDCPL